MAVVCDFQVIEGDNTVTIGDNNLVYQKTFDTSGRHDGGHAILMLMVSSLTAATKSVDVLVNGTSVGRIFPYRYAVVEDQGQVSTHWFTQLISIGRGVLNNGLNDFQLEAVDFPEATGTNALDDYQVRDIFCFYQQEVA